METEVGVEGNDEGKVEETGVEKSSSALSSPKQIADPVVYKLVRVEGDGRLVPATDDELMEVEDFLEDDKTEMHDVADSGQTVGHISDEGASSEKTQLESTEGLLKLENSEADAGKLNARPEEIIPSSAPSLNDNDINQSGTTVECPKPQEKTIENVSTSAIPTSSSSKPDFSKLNGEICLDKLSIRELHEVFKATFGRETTVKDKQWLKRRIAMGLTNSCDVSTTTFTIKDNKLVTKGEEECNKNVDGSFTQDPEVGATDVNNQGSPASHGSQMEDHQTASGKKLRSHSLELDSGSEHLHIEQGAAKRIRKPTRRYIEELSEVESKDYSQRLITSPKNAVPGQTSPKYSVRPDRNVPSEGRIVVTRLDSLGGSGVQVPYVSRVRRSRPRKNVMALMKFNPSSMGMEAKLVKKALGVHNSQTDDNKRDKVLKKRFSAEQIQQPFFSEVEKDRQRSVMGRFERGENLGLTQADSSGDNSDANVVTVPTAKGGMRRKHHRAWTLVEVMKLVDGVSKCGAGRWSEIKRLAFSSYSYRTSVDLKDKWRNLLKASSAQTPPDDGLNSRKPTSMPIPEHILLRVRDVRGELTLEYLLLLHNSSIASCQVDTNSNQNEPESASRKPIYIDSYPKLRAWYCQNKSCIASTLAGLSSGNPVHQVANKILSMIYWKMTKSGSSSVNSSTPSSSNASGSPANTGEDAYQRPMLPAWEVLEAIPFVLEAILTACAHGRLSSRDLTTGLRDLVDFLPASLAAIISYFSAEVTRGIWKPVQMNGKDWPSPAAILPSVESEIKAILAAAGVDVPSCSNGNSNLILPLPMAALVSLTITFKLDKSMEYIHAVAGLALENCASGCHWPSMPIIGSLWAQKVRRWHDFIVVSCSRSVFRQNKEAVAQLLRSCFTSFLGSLDVSTSSLSNQSSVNGLLGSTISASAIRPSIAPGFLYLRSCRNIHNVQYVNDVIVGLVAEYAGELATRWASTDSPRLKSNQASLSLATARAREVAALGASLLCVTGGVHLVQELFRDTIPTWLLSSRKERLHKVSSVSLIVEGYAMAYLLILSGAIVWGVEANLTSWEFCKRARIVGIHMDFLAGVLEGNISLGCDPATWKAYLSCLVGLMVSFTPSWIQEVKLETLRKLANGLRGWHECELALSLLERGGTAAIGSVAELVNVIS